jgi:hypothetical protein
LISSWNLSSKSCSNFGRVSGQSMLLRVKDLNCVLQFWCIHDYPALSTLSGWVTKGYFSCVCFDKDPCSRRLKKKICCIGHHHFLPIDHPRIRKRANFDGTVENWEKPE